jgi:4-aminobutyrate aminotransferase-like enzyme
MSSYKFNYTPQEIPKVETRNRKISTPIPAPGTEAMLNDLQSHESRSMHGQMPIIWDRAVDYNVFDIAGNKWIDFTSTIFVTNIGHANPKVVESVVKTLSRGLVHTYAYVHKLRVEYLNKLISFAKPNFDKAYLVSAGTEAVEAVIKLMRMNGQKFGKKHPGIICIEGNWHGRTMGAQFLHSGKEQKKWIGHIDPNVHHIPFPYPWVLGDQSPIEFLYEGLKQLESKDIDLENDICGFMLETFQGWGAVFYPKEFVQEIEKICQKKNIILAFDEMQAGFARTGKKFGYEHYDVRADLIACGKAMGSGFPLSGVLGSLDIMDLPGVGSMSSTHSASPIACAAGLATLEQIESLNLIEESRRKGILLHNKLRDLKKKHGNRISDTQGHGMIASVLFKKPGGHEPDCIFPSQVSEACMRKGLLVVHTGRESIKIGPPLTISDDALIEGLDVLDSTIFELNQGGDK